MTMDSNAAIAALDEVADQAADAAGRLLRSASEADHADFYAAGSCLSILTGALVEITGHLAVAVARYGHGRQLRDDAGADPEQRLVEATARLYDARAAYAVAAIAIADYHSAISHVAVDEGASEDEREDADGPGEYR